MAISTGKAYLAPEIASHYMAVDKFVKSLSQISDESLSLLKTGHEEEFISVMAAICGMQFQVLKEAESNGFDMESLQKRIFKKAQNLVEQAVEMAAKKKKA